MVWLIFWGVNHKLGTGHGSVGIRSHDTFLMENDLPYQKRYWDKLQVYLAFFLAFCVQIKTTSSTIFVYEILVAKAVPHIKWSTNNLLSVMLSVWTVWTFFFLESMKLMVIFPEIHTSPPKKKTNKNVPWSKNSWFSRRLPSPFFCRETRVNSKNPHSTTVFFSWES